MGPSALPLSNFAATSWLNALFLGQTLQSWLEAAGFALVVFTLLQAARRFVARKLARVRLETPERSATAVKIVFTLLSEVRLLPIVIVSLYLATIILDVPPRIEIAFSRIIVLMLIAQVGIWLNRLLGFWLERYQNLHRDDPSHQSMMAFLSFTARFVLFALLGLVALNNLGVNITAMVTGFGLGGLAVTFAVQNILKDLFSSVSIVLDKPFVVGDAINVGNYNGVIEKIGLKTTHVRSMTGELLIFSNTDLTSGPIRNFKRLDLRRNIVSFRVPYGTPLAILEKLPETVKGIIARQPQVRVERVHINHLADDGVRIEAVYVVLSPDYNLFMDVQQHILLEVYRTMQQLGIPYAPPVQNVLISRPHADGNGGTSEAEPAASAGAQSPPRVQA